eukprot:CAMPEP_0185769574 /NCGR_PEP_ID=MMETSP1174-20130828/54779_1 /TAXON_ID=35687 /ORGANISM="Dictyocha speculum, Strain CCMP1381" /LENGTH=350 /DNA_ID=CAMNT_0028454691 /DNA_START=228 /DNA_END=1277 /DNA_ORIENTATION=-
MKPCLNEERHTFETDISSPPDSPMLEDDMHMISDIYKATCSFDSVRSSISLSMDKEMELSDFEMIEVITHHGQFGLGEVWRSRCRQDGNKYAVMIQDDTMGYTHSSEVEKQRHFLRSNFDRFANIESDFVCCCKWFFETERLVCLVTNYMPLNLFQLQSSMPNKRFSERKTELYVMEILTGLNDLHSQDIFLMGNLKPENVLVGADGHISLTGYFKVCHSSLKNSNSNDFMGNTYDSERMLGSPEYMSPEMVKFHVDNDNELLRTYSVEVDYWSLGCLLYELLHGISPFFRAGIKQIFISVLNGTYHDIADDVSLEAADIIRQLLQPNPKYRLANVGSVERHGFFRSFRW